MFFPLMQMYLTLAGKKFLPLLAPPKKNEQMTLFVTERHNTYPIVFNNENEGVLTNEKFGHVEDKGTKLMLGGQPISIVLQKCGVAIDIEKAQYCFELYKEKGIDSYDEAVKAFLGPAKWVIFKKVCRRNPKPKREDIEKEISYLLDQQPNDPLSARVVGETVNFKHFLNFMKYVNNPVATTNAIKKHMISIQARERGYKMGTGAVWSDRAKAIAMILIVVMIVVVVITQVDFSKISGLF